MGGAIACIREVVHGSSNISAWCSCGRGDDARAAGEEVLEDRPYRRIACEEGFLTPEELAEKTRLGDICIPLITADGPTAVLARRLSDLGEGRLVTMDADGIDMPVLLLGDGKEKRKIPVLSSKLLIYQ
jgi:hypothetical protein